MSLRFKRVWRVTDALPACAESELQRRMVDGSSCR